MKSVTLLTLSFLFSPIAATACSPTGMVRMVIADGSPSVPKDSYARKPKVIYRAGALLARVEEAPDPEQGIQGLVVISAPDSWMVNLADKTGRHIVDPDPKSRVVMPVFAGLPSDAPSEFGDLGFGCELLFFTSHSASTSTGESAGKPFQKHVLTNGEWRLTLLSDAAGKTPRGILLSRQGQVVFAMNYFEYKVYPEVDRALFQQPEGIRFSAPE